MKTYIKMELSTGYSIEPEEIYLFCIDNFNEGNWVSEFNDYAVEFHERYGYDFQTYLDECVFLEGDESEDDISNWYYNEYVMHCAEDCSWDIISEDEAHQASEQYGIDITEI